MTAVDRRLPALVALVLFAVLTWSAGTVDPDGEVGAAALALTFAGYAAVLVGGALLVLQPPGAPARLTGRVLVVTALVMSGTHVSVLLSDAPDANIGAGILLLLAFLVVAGAALRLLLGLLADRRAGIGS